MKNKKAIKTICYFVGSVFYGFTRMTNTVISPFQFKAAQLCNWLHKTANGKDGIYYKAYCLCFNVLLKNGFWVLRDYEKKIIKISDKLKGWEYGVGYTNKPSFKGGK